MRRDALERDWTKGSTTRNLLSLSWPIIVHELAFLLGYTIDLIWVGKLGPASIAGVGIVGIVVMLLMSATWGLNAGTRAMVARFMGAGNNSDANHIARQAIVISGAYAIVVSVAGIWFAEPILNLVGLEADVVSEGAAYMRVLLAGTTAMSFWIMNETIMQASGDAVTPMKISIFIRCIHIALDPFLIFGWWIFPRMGVSGAALSNVITQSLGMTIGLWFLFTGRTRLRLTLQNFRLDFKLIWRIVKIGIPASIMGVQRSLGNLMLAWFIAPFGTFAVAAHSIMQRAEMIIFVPSMALGIAAGVLVGQNLGAHLPKRAEKSGWLAVGIIGVIMLVCSVVALLWAEDIIRIFGTEPDLIRVSSTFLRISAAGYLMLGLTAVMQLCISGAGDTVPPMIISLVMMWLVQLPLAFLLPRIANLGVYGVRWAIVIGMVVGAVAYIIYFWRGRWKRKKV